ncbi:MAG TPA: NifB/NifX family molybdenum-iron cluster-binding protein [Aggregatilinea sp.]|uniref:NifB/NifX family molybdenum-iron cluster-binding protein n=1 Tax=Aggregatilinea sp. TaxID=2806333 RepID=UPI002CA63708|nr:NifB/NifX family molybdenum-iron cluster-binding protein [Aggregatilinea sp.]HML24309.1 NifB/NifX family molybdenum-iron cluster-binding protein [Aggregatilinea sp.]
MKIAVVTEDGQTISQHFGRAPYYLVFTIEDGAIVAREQRDKANHSHFAGQPHEHEHGHEHGQGHGFGPASESKHNQMIASITDCEAAIVRGMGRGAYISLQQANIRPIVTDIASAEDAVRAYVDGSIVDHTERLH